MDTNLKAANPAILRFDDKQLFLFEKNISEDKSLHNDIGWWYRFLDSAEGVIKAIPKKGLDGVEDHSMSDYLKAVESWNWDLTQT